MLAEKMEQELVVQLVGHSVDMMVESSVFELVLTTVDKMVSN
jgi:hypothetical protein